MGTWLRQIYFQVKLNSICTTKLLTRNSCIISKSNVLWGTKEKTKMRLKYTQTIQITNCQTNKKYLPVEQQWSWRTVGHSLQTLSQQMGKCHRELLHLYSTDLRLQSRIHESKQEPGGNSTNTYLPGNTLWTRHKTTMVMIIWHWLYQKTLGQGLVITKLLVMGNLYV